MVNDAGSVEVGVSFEHLDIKEERVARLITQRGPLPPDFNRIKAAAITEGRLRYDEAGTVLYTLAPNGKPSHLTEGQWLLSRTDWVKDWLKWEHVFRKAGGSLIERKNFGSELARIKAENPVSELRALASAMSHNPELSQESHVLFSDHLNGSNYSLGHVLDTSELTGKYLIAAQSLIMPQSPPDDIFTRRQADVDETMLHEQVHCYTNPIIELYELFSNKYDVDELRGYTSDAAVNFAIKARDLFAIYKAQNGELNIHEFLAYGLTDIKPAVDGRIGINSLKRMKYTGEGILPNNVAVEALKQVGVTGSLYDAVLSTFINYYCQIDPQLYSDRVDENGDPLPEHVAIALARFRQLNLA